MLSKVTCVIWANIYMVVPFIILALIYWSALLCTWHTVLHALFHLILVSPLYGWKRWAIRKLADISYGANGVGIWTQDVSQAHAISHCGRHWHFLCWGTRKTRFGEGREKTVVTWHKCVPTWIQRGKFCARFCLHGSSFALIWGYWWVQGRVEGTEKMPPTSILQHHGAPLPPPE